LPQLGQADGPEAALVVPGPVTLQAGVRSAVRFAVVSRLNGRPAPAALSVPLDGLAPGVVNSCSESLISSGCVEPSNPAAKSFLSPPVDTFVSTPALNDVASWKRSFAAVAVTPGKRLN